MGIFSRLGTLIKSNLNDLITKAEDPEKMLAQVLLEMQQQLVDAKKAVAVAIADEKKLQKQYAAETDKAKEWERKAMVAVRAGDDGLARQALARRSTTGSRRSTNSSGSRRSPLSRSSKTRCASSTTRSRKRSARRTSSSL